MCYNMVRFSGVMLGFHPGFKRKTKVNSFHLNQIHGASYRREGCGGGAWSYTPHRMIWSTRLELVKSSRFQSFVSFTITEGKVRKGGRWPLTLSLLLLHFESFELWPNLIRIFSRVLQYALMPHMSRKNWLSFDVIKRGHDKLEIVSAKCDQPINLWAFLLARCCILLPAGGQSDTPRGAVFVPVYDRIQSYRSRGRLQDVSTGRLRDLPASSSS